ncbi:hypothetical protein KFL_000470185 [Klebsormidium nitens]|uniref:Uncharacterized protein n=1 Tax=Klebsormidium nitens TaxID=105231 RepID=A0A1Y1HNC6_KLENI|nr:hypothetical protein KFL_000470185 [Klebsormidium nitens]|eukprot:GAQ80145.1 hypothetical protein KFL_000470185 [Klebsormidium nitens]
MPLQSFFSCFRPHQIGRESGLGENNSDAAPRPPHVLNSDPLPDANAPSDQRTRSLAAVVAGRSSLTDANVAEVQSTDVPAHSELRDSLIIEPLHGPEINVSEVEEAAPVSWMGRETLEKMLDVILVLRQRGGLATSDVGCLRCVSRTLRDSPVTSVSPVDRLTFMVERLAAKQRTLIEGNRKLKNIVRQVTLESGLFYRTFRNPFGHIDKSLQQYLDEP